MLSIAGWAPSLILWQKTWGGRSLTEIRWRRRQIGRSLLTPCFKETHTWLLGPVQIISSAEIKRVKYISTALVLFVLTLLLLIRYIYGLFTSGESPAQEKLLKWAHHKEVHWRVHRQTYSREPICMSGHRGPFIRGIFNFWTTFSQFFF